MISKFLLVGFRGLLLFVFFTVTCQQSPEKVEKNVFENAINQININDQYQWLVILPGLGCHGCIQEAEDFMRNHIEDERILFVLTKISSLKILQQKIEVRISEHSNIFVDKENLFQLPTNNAIYPCVIQMKNGKILTHSFQNPSNEAFYQLKEML
jgi:thioredoxin-related protein